MPSGAWSSKGNQARSNIYGEFGTVLSRYAMKQGGTEWTIKKHLTDFENAGYWKA
jgi:predicted transcriptional regulator